MRITLWDRYWSARLGVPTPDTTKRQQRAIERRTTARGIRATARALGVSPSHLSQVVSGKRRSRRLESRLAAIGVKLTV